MKKGKKIIKDYRYGVYVSKSVDDKRRKSTSLASGPNKIGFFFAF